MMNEKRFKGYAEKTGQHYELIIIDEIGEEYILTDDFFKSKDVIFEIIDLLNVMNDTLVTQARENHKLSNNLNEQQATISQLKQEIKQYWKCRDKWKQEAKELKEENEQLKIANARWLDKSLQDRQIRYSNTNHKELTKKYLQLQEENERLKDFIELFNMRQKWKLYNTVIKSD